MLASVISWINGVSGGNEMIAGALTLSLSGAVVYALKELPQRIYNTIRRQVTTTLIINSGDYAKRILFARIMEQIQGSVGVNNTRVLTVDHYWTDTGRKYVVTLGRGVHFFVFRGRLCSLRRLDLDSSGAEIQKEEIVITLLGRNYNLIRELVSTSGEERDPSKIEIFDYDKGWEKAMEIPKVPIEQLALDSNVRQNLIAEIEHFVHNEEDYRRLGLPYKLTILLHGVPGTGKSSIIRSLASSYNRRICQINISEMTDSSFRKALHGVPPNAIVVLEDFDSADATKVRSGMREKSPVDENQTDGQMVVDSDDGYRLLTLSGILNTLDGIASLDSTIVMLTTNVRDSIDPALLRSGRVDLEIELPPVSPSAVQEHFERIFPSLHGQDITYPTLLAKEITEIKHRCKTDPEQLVEIFDEYRDNVFTLPKDKSRVV